MTSGMRTKCGIGIALVFGGLQLVPYGRDHDNPPATGVPAWDSARTEELAMRACGDCHSHETRWPWYSLVAPLSWRIQMHVDEGREHLNFSTFDQPQKRAHEAAEVVEEGEMPLREYLWLHPEARLDDGEKRDLVAGLAATFGRDRMEEFEDDDGDDAY